MPMPPKDTATAPNFSIWHLEISLQTTSRCVLLFIDIAGIGLAGLCCAAAGAHMMLTDIASVSQGLLAQNTANNIEAFAKQAREKGGSENETESRDDPCKQQCSQPWGGSRKLGSGSVAVGTLDFLRPMDDQVGHNKQFLKVSFTLFLVVSSLRPFKFLFTKRLKYINFQLETPSITSPVQAGPERGQPA
jgi:hypothetical protein